MPHLFLLLTFQYLVLFTVTLSFALPPPSSRPETEWGWGTLLRLLSPFPRQNPTLVCSPPFPSLRSHGCPCSFIHGPIGYHTNPKDTKIRLTYLRQSENGCVPIQRLSRAPPGNPSKSGGREGALQAGGTAWANALWLAGSSTETG